MTIPRGVTSKLPLAAIMLDSQDLADRSKPPQTPPLAGFKLPPTSAVRLPSGLEVVVVEDRRFPLVTVRMAFRAGSVFDPDDLPGLAEATAALLTEGTSSRTARQIAEELASIGGTLDASASEDTFITGGRVLSDNIERLMDLLADVILHPSFPGEEIALYQQNRTQELLYQRSQPATLAEEGLAQAVFGSHPYSRLNPTPEAIQKLNQEWLAWYRGRHLAPNNAVLILLGDLPSRENILRLIENHFGSLPECELPQPPPAQFPEPTRAVVLVDRPGSVQAEIRLGKLALDRRHPEHFPLLAGSTILGGGASSRLFSNIREKKGYAYSVGSVLHRLRNRGLFSMYAQVRHEVLGEALQECLAELERMAQEPVTAAELSDVKDYLSGNFVMSLETQSGLAGQLATIKALDLPEDYLETFTEGIRGVEPDQIQKAAAQFISPGNAAIVVVGDAEKIGSALERFGEARVTRAGP